jgi:glycosyltransferase involved in cell wall biosynthesis
MLREYVDNYEIDYVLSNCDVFTGSPDIGKDYRWLCYTPIDTEELTWTIADRLKNAYALPCCTHYIEKIIKDKLPNVRTYYCPYSVDTSQFTIVDRKEARKITGFSDDDYVFGMVAMNKGTMPRKAFPQVIEAFAEIHKKYPHVRLYLHTQVERVIQDMIDIVRILEENEVTKFTKRADPRRMIIGYTTEEMNFIYNSMDCFILCSYGEGMGVPIIEAQAAGIPVITQDYGPQAEVTKTGWKIEPGPQHWTNLNGHWRMPIKERIYDAMEQAINTKITDQDRSDIRHKVMEYDINNVYKKCWKPMFKELEKEVQFV